VTVFIPRTVEGFSNLILGSFAVLLKRAFIDRFTPGIIQPPM